MKTVCRIMHKINVARMLMPPSPAPKPATRASVDKNRVALFVEVAVNNVLFRISKTLRTAEMLSNKIQPTCANIGEVRLAANSPASIEIAKTVRLTALAVIFVLFPRRPKLMQYM